MRTSLKLLPIICLLLAAPADDAAGGGSGVPGVAGEIFAQASPAPPARDAAPTRRGTALISGRVIGADGRPLRRAQVRLSSTDMRDNRISATDTDGRFEFRDLPAGSYRIYGSKAPYITAPYGPSGTVPKAIDLVDGGKVRDADIVLSRGCVLTGRVLDESGDPVVEVYVSASRRRSAEGAFRERQGGPGRSTDDTGAFRLYGLPPGDYYVSAMPQGTSIGDEVRGDRDRSGYSRSYYPGTASFAEAQAATCRAGEEVSALDFTLVVVRTSRLSGRVIDSRGNRPAEGSVSLQDPESGQGGGSAIRPDGTFVINGVAPGNYQLVARTGLDPRSDAEIARLPILVAGEDVDGLVVQTARGGRLRGRVIPEPGLEFDFPPQYLMLYGAPAARGQLQPLLPGRIMVQADGSFEVPNAFGVFLLRATSGPSGWALKEVRLDGREVTDIPFALEPGEEVSGVEVMLTSRRAVVSGQVTDGQGRPVEEAIVLLFADDPARWGGSSRFITTTSTSTRSAFEIQTLPAGEYLAVAIPPPPHYDEFDPRDPELLEQLRPVAKRVTLALGETKVVDLKLTEVGRLPES